MPKATFKVHRADSRGQHCLVVMHFTDPHEEKYTNDLAATSQSGNGMIRLKVDTPELLDFFEQGAMYEVSFSKI